MFWSETCLGRRQLNIIRPGKTQLICYVTVSATQIQRSNATRTISDIFLELLPFCHWYNTVQLNIFFKEDVIYHPIVPASPS